MAKRHFELLARGAECPLQLGAIFNLLVGKTDIDRLCADHPRQRINISLNDLGSLAVLETHL